MCSYDKYSIIYFCSLMTWKYQQEHLIDSRVIQVLPLLKILFVLINVMYYQSKCLIKVLLKCLIVITSLSIMLIYNYLFLSSNYIVLLCLTSIFYSFTQAYIYSVSHMVPESTVFETYDIIRLHWKKQVLYSISNFNYIFF